MGEQCFEESLCQFWEECDKWIESRKNELEEKAELPHHEVISVIEEKVETKINSLVEDAVKICGENFMPSVLTDLHHLMFEIELKQSGTANEDRIHMYKDNAQVGLSVVEGKITPENALLIMRLNQAHLEKKGGSNKAICDDCVCGKK